METASVMVEDMVDIAKMQGNQFCINAYKIVQTDLNNQIESENNKSKKKKLKKLRNNRKKYSEHS